MERIKIGDIVSRSSYGNDILFYVDNIICTKKASELVILKGVTIRVQADAPIDDLVIVGEKRVNELVNNFYRKLNSYNNNRNNYKGKHFGKILHLDGDKGYSQKTERYYKNSGLNYVVKHIAENKQPNIVRNLLQTYKPDILVITGHDGMIRKGKNYSDLNNYRNSKYFVKSVIEARKWSPGYDNLVIFAGACQSYYEILISAGANFASSPARILIDFMDPLVVAEELSKAPANKMVFISDIESKIRNGRKAVDGIGAKGKNVT